MKFEGMDIEIKDYVGPQYHIDLSVIRT